MTLPARYLFRAGISSRARLPIAGDGNSRRRMSRLSRHTRPQIRSAKLASVLRKRRMPNHRKNAATTMLAIIPGR